jgi:hypothetical protein
LLTKKEEGKYKMEFESYDQFVLTLSSAEQDELKEILELVEDIKKSNRFSGSLCSVVLFEKINF